MFPLGDENPTRSRPFFLYTIIVINVLVFGREILLGKAAEAFIHDYAIIPWNASHHAIGTAIPPFLTLFTSMFLHGGFGHILGNLWFLYLFGDNIEDTIGHFRFLIFYLVCGMAAGLLQIFLDPSSQMPVIGASGAISGVLGGYILLFPRIRIRTLIVLGFFFDVVRIPAVFFLGLWFLMQALGLFGPQTGVAFGAHIGGFVVGMLSIWCLTRKQGLAPASRFESRRIPRF
ncbi:MAG: rhomboid family intramembrane serine protease [Deltaproteobacteria bacterium]|nr:rhomboid family intramembrane serine protease [Deltaproteobacteria bacterium]MBI3293504.1 rhomboid family intramembrane serine protease [Deltaproteobacteria bacterium]